jgi:hypothetical protein
MIYFMNSSTSEGKGARFSYQSVTENIDEQSCYVFNADESLMKRLCEKYKRQFSSRKLASRCFELELVDQDKCYQDIPHRITAYSRAVRELSDPDYSQEERNKMMEEDLKRLKTELSDLKDLIALKADTLEAKRNDMHAELLNVDFAQRDNLLSGFSFALSLNSELGGKPSVKEDKNTRILKNSATGYAFRIGQRVHDRIWLELGWSAATQTIALGADSSITSLAATDKFGVNYTQNRYLRGADETITIRRNTMPINVSYVFPLKNCAIDLEAFVGFGITWVSSVSSRFTEGTIDIRSRYDGFSSEISNVPALGLQDGQTVSKDIRLHEVKNAFCQSLGIRGKYKLIGGSSLFVSFGFMNSSGLTESNLGSTQYSLLNDLKTVKQNPINLSLGFNHCFKYEKK